MSAETLFCKPWPGIRSGETLFMFRDPQLGATISFRSLDLNTDLETIHHWVNQPYSFRYWQQAGPKEALAVYYRGVLASPLAHSFIAAYNDQPVGQLDLHDISEEEIKSFVPAEAGACAVHILMQPPSQSIKGLSLAVLKAFIRFYFSFQAASVLYGEPDKTNGPVNRLARLAGFQFIRELNLSNKTANLYSITRKQFYEQDHKF